ncbi:MAG: hypothetical protein QXT88_01045 [Desulfurococcaceae archaeon]|uniref:Uncharacterized protein n=1 Tax=Staphylothermus marinus TaxID=2280 RepID=A0A7C4JLQ5_STAMA
MTIGLFKGVNKAGHRGWSTVYCRICNKKLDIFKAYDLKNIYYCEKCRSSGIEAYFCDAHARNLHYRCPYCRNSLKPYLE